MASIEITENTVIRNLIRKGTNADRETITLASGELGFTTDSERVFVGNNTAQGGTAAGDYLVVGNKFLGEVASFSDVNALPGDTFKLGGNLYSRKIDYSGNASDATGYNLLGAALAAGDGLDLSSETLSVKIDTSGTLAFTSDGELTVGTITLADLPTLDANTLLGNFTTGSSVPQAVAVGGNSVMGRQSTSTLGSVTFDQILLGADGTGTATLKPTVSGLTVTELAGVGEGPVIANSSGTLSRVSTSDGTVFTQQVFYNTPYQIFGRSADGVTNIPTTSNAGLNTDGTLTDIDPWANAALTADFPGKPAGVKGAIVYGSVDTTIMPVHGATRGVAPYNWKGQRRMGITMFASLGTINDSFQQIFTAGTGEEDDGKPETASGGGQAIVILNSSGNFKIGLFGNGDGGRSIRNSGYWYFKLYLVGYCL